MEPYISKIESALSVSAIWEVLEELSNEFGLVCLCYHQVNFYTKGHSFKKIIFDELQGSKDHIRLAKEEHVADPINQAAVTSAEPFTWDQVQDIVQLNDRQRAFMQKAFRRLEQTITVPVFGPAGRNGYFCFEVEDVPQFKNNFSNCQVLLQFSHRKICAFGPAGAGQTEGLTPREREVLELVALGKSNAIIAQLLGISPHTVDTYMRRIYHKLGVTDRISAAIRAYGSGMVIQEASSIYY